MRVAQLMTTDIRYCHATDSLGLAAQIMWDNDCGCVPVVDDALRVVGMITDRDCAMAAHMRNQRLDEIPVGQVMAHGLRTCGAGDPVDTAERLMREAKVRRLPVVDDEGHLVGLLSLNDLVRHVRRDRGARPDGLAADAIVRTIAAISEPRGA